MSNDDIDVSVDVRFAMIPYWVLLHEDISPVSLRVYGVIRKHADNETGVARPSRATLARLCRISVKTIDRCLRELEAAGAVEVRARWRNIDGSSFRSAPDGEHVVRAPSLYVVKSIPPPKPGGSDTNVPTPVGTSEGGGDTDDATGGDTDVAGVGTPVTHELDPVDLDPEELEGGCVTGVPHVREPAPVDNPSPDADSIPATDPAAPPAQWCPAHPGGTDEPCAPCGARRRARADWEAQQAADRAAAHRAEIAARHAAEAARIADCGMCDADGFTGPGVRCVHDPAVIDTARRGAARVRAALAATARRHTAPPPDPEHPPASKPARRTPAPAAAPA